MVLEAVNTRLGSQAIHEWSVMRGRKDIDAHELPIQSVSAPAVMPGRLIRFLTVR